MGFTAFVVQTRAQLAQGTGFAVSLKKIRDADASLVFTLRPSVAERLGWGDKTSIAILIGEDEQRGLMRLKADKDGSVQLLRREAGKNSRVSYFSLTLGHVPAFPNRSEEKRWVQFEQVEDGWVEVVLPKWADPQRAPAAPVRNAALELAVNRRPTGSSVVGQMMGDPPKNRSALAPQPTRGEARRAAEEREADTYIEAERADAEREISAADELATAMTTFGLTRTEGRYLLTLLDGRLCTKERLLQAGHDEGEEIEIKIVDVFVHKLRAKLGTRLVMIDTVRAQGYRMSPESIARARRLMDEAAPRVAAE